MMMVMAFSEEEILMIQGEIEEHFWKKRRPPVSMRDQIREGQRISGHCVELYFSRPCFFREGEWLEEPIAKFTYVRKREIWRIFWHRADGKWHRYPPCSKVGSLKKALQLVDKDENACFFG